LSNPVEVAPVIVIANEDNLTTISLFVANSSLAISIFLSPLCTFALEAELVRIRLAALIVTFLCPIDQTKYGDLLSSDTYSFVTNFD
jgi:hypothetical protein